MTINTIFGLYYSSDLLEITVSYRSPDGRRRNIIHSFDLSDFFPDISVALPTYPTTYQFNPAAKLIGVGGNTLR